MKYLLASLLLAAPAFALPEGYEITTWAEPFNIEYPTALTAAADGTVYVSCDRNGSLGKLPNMGKAVSCKDTNGDGKADRFIDFVPNVDSPRGGHFVRDTLYLVHPPFLSSFRDTDGDGVADEKKVLLKNLGFGLRHPRGSDHTTNACRMGIDGWLYIAVGDFGMEGTIGTDGRTVTLQSGAVARVRPDGTGLELYSTGVRNICDIAISPRMDLFSRDNTNDGKGWNIRVHHFTQGSEHGYPRLYKNFADEAIAPMLDLGGGSGTGALYLAEPGHEEMLLTCDWTTGKIYHDQLTPNGASFTAKESVFMNLGRAVDIDVDGESNLYVCDWRDGKYSFLGEGKKVGLIQKITKKGFQAEKFPDLTKLSDEELAAQLRHQSAVRRLEAQREILEREVLRMTKHLDYWDSALSDEAKIATAYTFGQLLDHDFTEAGTSLRYFGNDLGSSKLHEAGQVVREHLVRSISGHPSLNKITTLYDSTYTLSDTSPRVRLQAIIALGRLLSPPTYASDPLLKLDLKPSDARAWQARIQALVSIRDIDQLLTATDQRAARLALMRIHDPKVVDGIIAKIKTTPPSEQLPLIEVLARLSHREGEWDKKYWWGTRPDDRGPYFNFVEWEQTPRIFQAFEEIYPKLAAEDQIKMLGLLGRNRVPVSKLKLGDQDPITIALMSTILDAGQIQILTDAAKDPKRDWELRLKSYHALSSILDGQNIFPQINILGTWLTEKIKPTEVERELTDFTNQSGLSKYRRPIRAIAMKEGPQMSHVAWRTLLTLVHSPLASERTKKDISKMLAKNPREEGLFLALTDLRLLGYDEQIENAINSDNDTLIEVAKHAKEVIAQAAASGGKKVSELKPDEVTKLAMSGQGDAARGKLLYSQQACITCHAVDQKAVQKGPYLGSAGSKFTKDYLIESILDPNAVVAQGFQTELVTMKDKTAHMGFVTREEDGSIDLRNIAGQVTTLKESDIAKRDHQPTSMMPPGLGSALTVDQFNDLIAYLTSLRE